VAEHYTLVGLVTQIGLIPFTSLSVSASWHSANYYSNLKPLLIRITRLIARLFIGKLNDDQACTSPALNRGGHIYYPRPYVRPVIQTLHLRYSLMALAHPAVSTYDNGWHPGESAAQRAMGFDGSMPDVHNYIRDEMPDQHRLFHSELAYIALTSLDSEGRPWGSLLTANSGEASFISSPHPRQLLVGADVWEGDPIAAYEDGSGGLVAGLGIMFHNRRRNKFAGRVSGLQRVGGQLNLSIQVEEAVGYVINISISIGCS
jgi:predicted pyridoxine 5'-phosphate oxidase superfamily flavin-nucleotide-binding protein